MKESKNFVNKISSFAILTASSFNGLAQESVGQVATNPKLNSPTDGALLPLLMALVAIILLIYGLAWLARKFNFTPNHHHHMKTITSLSLGGRERIVIIEVQGVQYALGVTPHSVNQLFKLEEPITPTSLMNSDNKLLNKLTEMLNNGVQSSMKKSDVESPFKSSTSTKKE